MIDETPQATMQETPMLQRIAMLGKQLVAAQIELQRCNERITRLEATVGINPSPVDPRNY